MRIAPTSYVALAVLAACGPSSVSVVQGEPDAAPDVASPDGATTEEPEADALGSQEGSPEEDAPADITDDGPCAIAVESHPVEGNLHQPICSPLTYGTNPPSSGDHYGIWAAYKTYAAPFPP